MNSGSLSSNNQFPELQNYTWTGVLTFLNEQCKNTELERTLWQVEKRQLTERISQLEGEVKAQENINQDLTRRVKMLEYSLRQERIKYAKLTGGHHRVNSDMISSILSRAEKDDTSSSGLPRRRSRAHRQLLSKYLQELGLDDIFTGDMPTRPAAHHRPSKSYGSALQNLMQPPQPEAKTVQKAEPTALPASEEKSKPSWDFKISLKSHMDGVRCMHFSQRSGIFASGSEDCTVKLWDISDYENLNENSFFEPYYTLRGHSGAIFAMDGSCFGSEQIIYTAGEEGSIRVWEAYPSNEMNAYGEAHERGYCAGVWSSHTEPVWDLKHHPVDNLLLSCSADGVVKLWRTLDIASSIENWEAGRNSSNLLKNFTFPTSKGDTYNTPTTCAWLTSELNSFLVGYTSPYLNIFDKQTVNST